MGVPKKTHRVFGSRVSEPWLRWLKVVRMKCSVCDMFGQTYCISVCVVCIVVVAVLLVWMSVVVSARNPKAPKWPDCYSVKAVLRLPYAELEEPITAYYEGAKNRSRIDYYGWIFLMCL